MPPTCSPRPGDGRYRRGWKTLIEDAIAAVWNQGNAWRLDSCLAVWNGEEFDLLYDEGPTGRVMMG